MDEKEKITINFLKKCNIIIENWNELNNQLIPRDLFLSDEIYKTLKDDIEKLKKIYSTSSLTSMQSNAEHKQKWCLLNLVRQILKINNYHMVPIRKASGYDLNKKKKFIRYFLIEKINIKNDLYLQESI
jgi:hypothetical protein